MASSKTNGKLSTAPKIARLDNQETPTPQVPGPPKRTLKISTVSHTLDSQVAEKLRYFAFRERISESAVIEFALRVFFESGDDPELGTMLRESGAALRRKS